MLGEINMSIKKCPFFHRALELVYIKSNGEVITWSPNPKKKSIFTIRWHVYENEIKLALYSLIKGAKVEAYKCGICNKIIIDIDDKLT